MVAGEPNQNTKPLQFRRDLAILLFATSLGAYAYFWQSRDWNAASRLMLTYSLVDRQQVAIDGLEGQAGYGEFNPATGRVEMVGGDLARLGSHYYTDKAPGQSLLGAVVYSIPRFLGILDEHPLNEAQARAYWPADYIITLGSSGLLTALLSVIIYAFSLRLGATHRGAILLGLAYGLATPALVYATLFYGHQASAFCTFTSFFLLYRARNEGRDGFFNMFVAGLLAGYSLVVEYQTAVISAMLGVYACVAIRKFRPVFVFGLAAVLAASGLAAYNYAAFGDPFDLGYAHEVSREFRNVHPTTNPLGLQLPGWQKIGEVLPQILWTPFRGLVFYAPVLCAVPLGFCTLLWRRQWGVALVGMGALVWMATLNLSYPLWEGGWCTGPRFMVPAIPFAVLLVGGLIGGIRHAWVTSLVGLATLYGAILMIACVAVSGRFPTHVSDPQARSITRIDNPVKEIVLPHWRGRSTEPLDRAADGTRAVLPATGMCPFCQRHPSSYLAGGHQFERNVGRWLMERVMPSSSIAEPSAWQGLQIGPLLLYLTLMVSVSMFRARDVPART